MNFLDLCKSVVRESGTLAGGVPSLTSVVGQSGRADKIVAWVADAWLNIQLEHSDWLWMRREFSAAPLTIGKARYTANDLNVTRFGSWITESPDYCPFTLYDPTIGVADEGGLGVIDYGVWRGRYGQGAQQQSRPVEFAVSPLMEICVGQFPDKAYRLSGEYQASPQILAANADVPEMPPEYHRIIVWEAIKIMSGVSDEAPNSVAPALAEYVALRDALSRQQRPKVTIGVRGGPIA